MQRISYQKLNVKSDMSTVTSQECHICQQGTVMSGMSGVTCHLWHGIIEMLTMIEKPGQINQSWHVINPENTPETYL